METIARRETVERISKPGQSPAVRYCIVTTRFLFSVIPAQAGIQCRNVDSRLRGNDENMKLRICDDPNPKRE
jgi:hypothetical protein